jgi:hypothetical protein
VHTHIVFLFSKKRKTRRFAGFAGLYSPKGVKKRSIPSQGSLEAGREGILLQRLFSARGSTNLQTCKPAKPIKKKEKHVNLNLSGNL